MNKNNYRTCVGGILLLAAGILSIVIQLLSFVATLITQGGSMSTELSSVYIQNLVTTIVTNIPIIVLGVVLLMKKRGILITILSGILLAFNIISLISNIIASVGSKNTDISMNWLGAAFSAFAFAALLILSIVTMNPQPSGLKKLWFLPGACYAVYAISTIIFTINLSLSLSGAYMDPTYKIGFIVGTIIGSLPVYGLYTAAYTLTGHWLANPYKKGYQPQQAQPQYQYQQPQYQQYQQPAQPQYDEQTMQALNYYKWQYESGAITWEQYNAAIQPYLNHNHK